MTRLPGTPVAVRKADPDIYSVLLLIGVLFMLAACVSAFIDLTQNYGLTVGQLFSGAEIPR